MFKLAAHIACAIFLGDLGFILLARSKATEDVRYWAIYVALAYLLFLGIRSAKSTPYKVIFYASFAASIIFSSLYQVMGYTCFPGIVKDRDFSSWENIHITLILVLTSTILLFIGFASVKFIMRYFIRSDLVTVSATIHCFFKLQTIPMQSLRS